MRIILVAVVVLALMLGRWAEYDLLLPVKVVQEKLIKIYWERKVANEEYKKFIREKEGKELLAYKPAPNAKPGDVDYEKYYTIGYGHYGPDVKEGQTITEAQAEALLDKDVTERLTAIRKAIKDFDSFPEDIRVDLFASWYRGGLSGSPNTIKLINEGKYEEAAQEFLNNKEYRTTTLDGIKNRMEITSQKIGELINFKDSSSQSRFAQMSFADQGSQDAFMDVMSNSNLDQRDKFLKDIYGDLNLEELGGPWNRVTSSIGATTKFGIVEAQAEAMISEDQRFEEPDVRYGLKYRNGGFSAEMFRQGEKDTIKASFRKKF